MAAWAATLLSLGLLGARPAAGQPDTPAAAQADPAIPKAIRFGFSRGMFRDVNENDVHASLKAYAAVIAHDCNLTTQPDPLVFEGTAELAAALRRKQVDIVAAPAAELLALPADLVTGPYLLTVNANVASVEYLLLTRVDSRILTLADLKGRRVAVLNNLRGSLANCWLDVLLAAGGLGIPREFFDELKFVSKPSLAVLPVFFGNIDACVITRESLALEMEMNPQIGRRLRILATSPEVVPVITCFRRDFDATLRRRVVESLASLQASIPGRQLLTIFQSDRVEPRGDSDLASTRQLLADHGRLHAVATAMPAPATRSTP